MSTEFLILLGGLLICIGGYWLHVLNKRHSLWKRLSAVSTTMMGCVLLWLCAAFNAPAFVNEKVEVVVAGPDWMVVRVEYTQIRNCTTKDFHAVLIQGTNQVELETVYLPAGKSSEDKDYGFVVVMNDRYIVPDYFYLEINHDCPLGIEIPTILSKIKVPEEFNLVEDDGYQI